MQMKLFYSSLAVLVFFIIGFSVGGASAQGTFKVIAVSEFDAEREVIMNRGDVLVVFLKEVSTAGYVWELVDFDRDRLLLLKSDSIKLSPPNVLGGNNLRVFYFRAIDLGRAYLKIAYHRPWEKFKAPGKTFCLRVLVE